jgi:hypothetical protein
LLSVKANGPQLSCGPKDRLRQQRIRPPQAKNRLRSDNKWGLGLSLLDYLGPPPILGFLNFSGISYLCFLHIGDTARNFLQLSPIYLFDPAESIQKSTG